MVLLFINQQCVREHLGEKNISGAQVQKAVPLDVLACQIVADVPSLHWAAAAEVQALAFFSR